MTEIKIELEEVVEERKVIPSNVIKSSSVFVALPSLRSFWISDFSRWAKKREKWVHDTRKWQKNGEKKNLSCYNCEEVSLLLFGTNLKFSLSRKKERVKTKKKKKSKKFFSYFRFAKVLWQWSDKKLFWRRKINIYFQVQRSNLSTKEIWELFWDIGLSQLTSSRLIHSNHPSIPSHL